MLRTQYRCHPHISAIANNLFYNHDLRDGDNVKILQKLIAHLPHLGFVDINNGVENYGKGGSLSNNEEAVAAAKIVQVLLQRGIPAAEIGVIALCKRMERGTEDYLLLSKPFYSDKSQAFLIEQHLKDQKGVKAGAVQVSTVDAFQGGEKTVILLSTVRSKSTKFIDNGR